MAFISRMFCTDCECEVEDIQNHNCSCSPEKLAASEKEHAEDEARMKAWDEWEEQFEVLRAHPAVDALPTDIACRGRCIIFDIGDDNDFISLVCENPTWGEVVLLLDDAMRVTGDYHHCYMEGLTCGNITWPATLKERTLADDITVLNFVTGS